MPKCLLSLLLLPLLASAQSSYENVMIDQQVSVFEYAPCEPSIAINPTNTDEVVGGAILDKVYLSSDGGQTWEIKTLEASAGVFGDPCIVSNVKGDFYYLHLSDPSGRGWSDDTILDRIVCQRSRNGGKKWSKGGDIGKNHPKDQDKEWAVTHPESCEIYTSWTQFDKYDSPDPMDSTIILFSKSNKRAKNWSEPVRINQYAGDCLDDDQTTEGAVPAVGPNGELYVAWALEDKIYFDRSLDNGESWLEEDIVAGKIKAGWNQQIPGINRCNGMPVTLVDLSSGPNRGTIYINYVDDKQGSQDHDVFVIKSTDSGNSWSNPIRINDDTSGQDQFFTWMAIDQTNGHLYTVFYDRRNYDDLRTDVYLASSADGGKTWLNERISEFPFIPTESMFFGDYNNISAHDGVVRPIWTRMDSGMTSVWTALIQK
ncbi:MAG: exo-alpha-sialidase [Flavobacteriales bacterium]|nr:exo-alpha-sialidase [Flavobacteriales bacterium]